MRRRLGLSGLGVAVVLLGACDGRERSGNVPPDGESVGDPPVQGRLDFARALVIPDTTARTQWLSRINRIRFVDGHLFVADRDLRTVSEVTTEGELIRTFGGSGGGPGEFEAITDFGVADRAVYVLDNRSARLTRFTRDEELVGETRLGRVYRDLAILRGHGIALVPGRDGAPFDLFGFDGEPIGTRGAPGTLPTVCLFCQIAPSGDGVAVVDSFVPALLVFDADGGLLGRHEFRNVTDLIQEWYEVEKRVFAQGGGKVWVTDVIPAAPGLVALAMSPGNVFEVGREVWFVDTVEGRVVMRLHWSGPHEHVGWSLSSFPRFFTAGYRDGGIYEYDLPPEASSILENRKKEVVR